MPISRRRFLKSTAASAAVASTALRALPPSCHPPASAQIAIPQVERMPNIPQPFKMRDWRQTAIDLDAYAFDLNAKGPHMPLRLDRQDPRQLP